MTDNQSPKPEDYRRATALIVHHRRGDTAGVIVIAEETNAENRGPQLLNAILSTHKILIGMLRTQSGINVLADWVAGMAARQATDAPGTDVVRAAQILNFHGHGDGQAIAGVMNRAASDGRATHVLMQLLDLYEVALPELSGQGGLEWLTAQIPAIAEAEHRDDDGESGKR